MPYPPKNRPGYLSPPSDYQLNLLLGVEQGSAFSLGKTGLAGLAIEQAALLGTVVSAHSEVTVAAFTVVQTIRILAAEECEAIYDKGWFHVVQG